MEKTFNIITNGTEFSSEVANNVKAKLSEWGYTVTDEFSHDAELTITIGGDGLFLDSIQDHDLPEMPFVGINTGHLGFFQEVAVDDMYKCFDDYLKGNYTIQTLPLVKVRVESKDGITEHYGMNEITLRGPHTSLIHLDVFIGENFIERFSGDGILVATPAGSTAYNYSLGGSIVDPRIKVLQMTPIAPNNTTAYRSFISSLMLPPEQTLEVEPDLDKLNDYMYVVYDGCEHMYEGVTKLSIGFSDKEVKLIRFAGYDFWDKVMTKFL